jgi:hypothetical protein
MLFFEVLDFSLHFEGELLDILLPLFLELIELFIILEGRFFEIFGFHVELSFELMDPTSIQFLKSS